MINILHSARFELLHGLIPRADKNDLLGSSSAVAINHVGQALRDIFISKQRFSEACVCGRQAPAEEFSCGLKLHARTCFACNLIIIHSCIKSLFAHNSKHIDLGTPARTWWSTSSHSGESSSLPFRRRRQRNTDEAEGWFSPMKRGRVHVFYIETSLLVHQQVGFGSKHFWERYGDSNVKQFACCWDEFS